MKSSLRLKIAIYLIVAGIHGLLLYTDLKFEKEAYVEEIEQVVKIELTQSERRVPEQKVEPAPVREKEKKKEIVEEKSEPVLQEKVPEELVESYTEAPVTEEVSEVDSTEILPAAVVVDTSDRVMKRWLSSVSAAIKKAQFYPHQARRMGMEGEIELRLRVDRNGEVISKELIKKSRYSALNNAALQTVERLGSVSPIPEELPDEELELIVPLQYILE